MFFKLGELDLLVTAMAIGVVEKFAVLFVVDKEVVVIASLFSEIE